MAFPPNPSAERPEEIQLAALEWKPNRSLHRINFPEETTAIGVLVSFTRTAARRAGPDASGDGRDGGDAIAPSPLPTRCPAPPVAARARRATVPAVRRPTVEDSLEALRAQCLLFEDMYREDAWRDDADGADAAPWAKIEPAAPPPKAVWGRAMPPRQRSSRRSTVDSSLVGPTALAASLEVSQEACCRGSRRFDRDLGSARFEEFRYFLNHDQVSFQAAGPAPGPGARTALRRRAHSACARGGRERWRATI